MKIAVTSQNRLKLEVVREVYSSYQNIYVLGFEAKSGVGEQPVGNQTLMGARNRISDFLLRYDVEVDRIISIENGIFKEKGQWVDRGVVVIYNPYAEKGYIKYSDGVVFPDCYVNMASIRGFDITTVGDVMQECGFVSNRKDPHLSISGISRRTYLEKTLQKLFDQVEKS